MSDTEPRDCLGKLWEEDSPECAGGLDPFYVNPSNGSKIRAKCELFDECRRRMQERDGKLIELKTKPPTVSYSLPTQSGQTKAIVTPPPITYSLPQKPAYAQPQPTPPPQPPMLRDQTYYPQPPPSPPPQQQQPHYYPAVFHPTMHLQPYEAPPFLTVLEPVLPGDSPWKRILMEALRAAAKGMLNHGSYVVDHMPVYQRGK